MKGKSAIDYLEKLEDYKLACISCRKLWTEFGEFDVVMKDTIAIEEYAESFMAIVTTKFWHQFFLLPEITIIPSGGLDILLDGYNLEKDFGIYISSRSEDKSVSKRIEVNTTSPYMQTQYREPKNATFGCSMIGGNLPDLFSRMGQFHALCMKPGLRILQLSEKEIYNLYFKDGMGVKAPSNTLLKFDLKCRVVK